MLSGCVDSPVQLALATCNELNVSFNYALIILNALGRYVRTIKEIINNKNRATICVRSGEPAAKSATLMDMKPIR
jgi:hypothetical protein